MNYFKYLRRGLAVIGLLTTVMPEVLADGKVTVGELSGVFIEICKICNWDVHIDVPDDVRSAVLGIVGE